MRTSRAHAELIINLLLLIRLLAGTAHPARDSPAARPACRVEDPGPPRARPAAAMTFLVGDV
jgi:hypothetical protein